MNVGPHCIVRAVDEILHSRHLRAGVEGLEGEKVHRCQVEACTGGQDDGRGLNRGSTEPVHKVSRGGEGELQAWGDGIDELCAQHIRQSKGGLNTDVSEG